MVVAGHFYGESHFRKELYDAKVHIHKVLCTCTYICIVLKFAVFINYAVLCPFFNQFFFLDVKLYEFFVYFGF